MRFVHGIAGVEKIQSGAVDMQGQVRVTDGRGSKILLFLTDAPYAAALTTEEARYIAECLHAAATRIEKEDEKS